MSDDTFKAAVSRMQEATLPNVANRMIAMTEDALYAVGESGGAVVETGKKSRLRVAR